MANRLQYTTLDGFSRPVVLTKGMVCGATGRTIYGVFASPADARSKDADELALGTVGAQSLTPEQREIAERNSEAICPD